MSRVPPARSIRVGAVASPARTVMDDPPRLLPLAPMNPPMDCPRCGQAAVTEAACPRCGVIVAKARATRAVPAARTPASSSLEPAPPPRSGMSGLAMGLIAALLVLAGAVGSRLWERAHRKPGPAVAGEPAAAPREPASNVADVPPPSLAIPPAPPLRDLQLH